MKQLFLFSAVLLLTNFAAYSQTYSSLRPVWAMTTSNPPAGANYFLNWGMGEGSNEQQATNRAWADALKKSLHELGVVGITNQDIDAVAEKGIEAVVSFNKMKRRALCTTKFIPQENGQTGKVYVLIQVQRNVNGKDDFYEADTHICNDPVFDEALTGYLTGDYPFSPRAFIPGMAQLHKGSKGKGILFIVGEIALVGGIVAFEGLRTSYESKINTTHDAASKRNYIDNADNMQNLRNGFIAGAAALYVWNVIDGIVGKGKKHVTVGTADVRFLPYVTPNTGGISLAINF
jgi:hypothetical protein